MLRSVHAYVNAAGKTDSRAGAGDAHGGCARADELDRAVDVLAHRGVGDAHGSRARAVELVRAVDVLSHRRGLSGHLQEFTLNMSDFDYFINKCNFGNSHLFEGLQFVQIQQTKLKLTYLGEPDVAGADVAGRAALDALLHAGSA